MQKNATHHEPRFLNNANFLTSYYYNNLTITITINLTINLNKKV